jgi:hypothetical protein
VPDQQQPTHQVFDDDETGNMFFHIETSPSVSPRLPQHDEPELPDSLVDHYNQAQIIRRQFLGGNPAGFYTPDAEELLSPPPLPQTPRQPEDYESQGRGHMHPGNIESIANESPSWASQYDAGSRNRQNFEQEDSDVYEYYLEDAVPPSLPEQQGSALVEDVDTGVTDLSTLSERPTNILDGEIEYLGDEGDFLAQPETFVSGLHEPLEDEFDARTPSRGYGSRYQTGREEFDDDEMLPPAAQVRQPLPPSQANRPVAFPPVPPVTGPGAPVNGGQLSTMQPSGRTGAGQREQPGARANGAQRVQERRQTPDRRPALAGSRQAPARPVGSGRQPQSSTARPGQRRQPAQQKNDRTLLTGFLLAVACLMILLALFYFLPTARVTISLPSRSMTASALHFSATTNASDTALNTVASQVLTFKKSVTGSGNATGTSQVGNAKATGQVNFTNHGAQQVEIPTGTSVVTISGVQFVTTADAVIFPSGGGFNPPIPVEAMNVGTSGNVPAGSITVIPAASLTAIAQYNNVATSTLNLSVTNTQALTGGGAVAASAVTSKDIQTEKALLDKQLQADFQTWLSQQLHAGDIKGTPIQQPDTIATNPATGQVTKDGKFSMTVTTQASVLVVRASALQVAAAKQLNAKATQSKPAYMLVTGQKLTFSKVKVSPSKNGSAIAITLDATGPVIQAVSTADISAALTGKSIGQATSDINDGTIGLHSVLRSSIAVSPGFLPLLPFRAQNISVILLPAAAPTQGIPNG